MVIMLLVPWEEEEEPDESSPMSMPGISCRGKFMLRVVVRFRMIVWRFAVCDLYDRLVIGDSRRLAG